ncbi:hypothetical protein FJZ48_01015 [Candidatus Uhrbacteria bacterium]|nr:hypothetical protein [Candidatus Uhrbacteria bacterium]
MRNLNLGITLATMVVAGTVNLACTANPDALGNGTRAIGESCDDKNTFCAKGECRNGICACTANSQCAQGQTCDLASGKCVGGSPAMCGKPCGQGCTNLCGAGGSCTNFGDCMTGLVCDNTGKCASTTPSTGSCSDFTRNGTETDVDCGGRCGATCGYLKQCAVNADCASGSCLNNTCQRAANTHTCNDGFQNQNESDVDCGGVCNPCVNGRSCNSNADCASNRCLNGTCNPVNQVTCQDGVFNGAETDVDCGGGVCPRCGINKFCGGNADCLSGLCSSGRCVVVASCNDGVRNQDETDVDCGGVCAKCANGRNCGNANDCQSGACNGTCYTPQQPPQPSCNDGLRNQNETDVDCGGVCAKCANGKFCSSNADCVNGSCNGNICGGGNQCLKLCGGCAPPCIEGQSCGIDSDCRVGLVCRTSGNTMTCQQPQNQCSNGIRDGLETGIDCGGNNACSRCPNGVACGVGGDCVSGNCQGGFCAQQQGGQCGSVGQACCANNTCPGGGFCSNGTCTQNQGGGGATCQDGLHNNQESDTDCGGPNCGRCSNGRRCQLNTDCVSLTCSGGFCANANTCNNGQTDVGETDVDCGGQSCAGCAFGRVCKLSSDCQQGLSCVGGRCGNQQQACANGAGCGLGCNALCGLGQTCRFAEDCSSNACVAGTCIQGGGKVAYTVQVTMNGNPTQTRVRQWEDWTSAVDQPGCTANGNTVSCTIQVGNDKPAAFQGEGIVNGSVTSYAIGIAGGVTVKNGTIRVWAGGVEQQLVEMPNAGGGLNLAVKSAPCPARLKRDQNGICR